MSEQPVPAPGSIGPNGSADRWQVTRFIATGLVVLVAIVALGGMLEARAKIDRLEDETTALPRGSADAADVNEIAAAADRRVAALEGRVQQLEDEVEATTALLELAALEREDVQLIAEDAAADAALALQFSERADRRLADLESCVNQLYGRFVIGCTAQILSLPAP